MKIKLVLFSCPKCGRELGWLPTYATAHCTCNAIVTQKNTLSSNTKVFEDKVEYLNNDIPEEVSLF